MSQDVEIGARSDNSDHKIQYDLAVMGNSSIPNSGRSLGICDLLQYTRWRHSDALAYWRVATYSAPSKYKCSNVCFRRRRVFNIDIQTCSACGGAVKVIACIQDPAVIEKILTHLQEKIVPKGPSAPKPGTACRSVRLTRQDPPVSSDGCFPQDAAGYRLAPGLKMDVQTRKTRWPAQPQSGKHFLVTNRVKNAGNGSSIDPDFREKGFCFTSYTYSE